MLDNQPMGALTGSVGLPPGISADAVLARKRALIEAGTDPLFAEKLATDAEVQQARRDQLNAEADAAADANAKAAKKGAK